MPTIVINAPMTPTIATIPTSPRIQTGSHQLRVLVAGSGAPADDPDELPAGGAELVAGAPVAGGVDEPAVGGADSGPDAGAGGVVDVGILFLFLIHDRKLSNHSFLFCPRDFSLGLVLVD